jgi:cytochrome c-type biogenesis protein CcmE
MNVPLKAKHQRLTLVLIALAALIGAGLLAAWSLRNQASFFYLPTEMLANPPATGRAVRLGGMVEAGSIKNAADGVTIRFVVGDGTARIPVEFKGIVPDLFNEGSGVVAEGQRRADGTFVASNLLAKHDEKYVPREMKDMTEAQARKTVEETK